MYLKTFLFFKILFAACFLVISANTFSQKIGIFDGQTDVGKVLHKGSANYSSSSQYYLISAPVLTFGLPTMNSILFGKR